MHSALIMILPSLQLHPFPYRGKFSAHASKDGNIKKCSATFLNLSSIFFPQHLPSARLVKFRLSQPNLSSQLDTLNENPANFLITFVMLSRRSLSTLKYRIKMNCLILSKSLWLHVTKPVTGHSYL